MKPTFNVHLRLPPTPRYARSARVALAAFASYHHIAPLELEDLTFALGEAMANAIKHAGSPDDIDVAFRIDDSVVVATVRDRGRGVADRPPARRMAAVPLPADSSEVGRGFAIMQRCTDFFDVRRAPGGGTIVTLGRYRDKDRERPQAS